MAGVQIDGVNNKIDFDDDLDTSISANTDDTLVIEAGGNTMATITATTFTINDGTTITTADNTDTLTLKSTDADASVGPVLLFNRDSGSPANNDFLGTIDFQGDNSAGDAHDYIRILSRILSTTDGSEQADLVIKDATGNNIVNMAHTEVVYNDDSVDRDFRVESNGNANMLFVDGGNNHVCIGTATDHGGVLNVDGPILMSESDTLLLRITSSSENVKFQSRVSDKDIRFEGIDGGVDITALHLDMSDGGQLITSNGATINGQSQIEASLNDVVFYVKNTATSGNVYGQQIQFSSTVNDASNYFFRCLGNNNSTVRAAIYSNGDFDSATNSYGATSDERIKQNITDANSQWDDIKGLKVRNFKLKDEARTEAGGGQAAKTYLGLVAQEAETVSPGLVKSRNPEKADILSSSEFGTLYEDGDDIPEGKEIGDVKEVTEQVKSVSYSVLYMKAIKALQEAQTRIETLETKVAALEG